MQNERPKRYMKVLLVVFREQNPFGTIWSFEPLGYFLLFEHGQIEPGHCWSLNSQGMLSFMITTRSLNNQNMTRTVKTLFLKQWRHYFSGKYLRDRYCIDITWCLCEGQNSWFCKASLRIWKKRIRKMQSWNYWQRKILLGK